MKTAAMTIFVVVCIVLAIKAIQYEIPKINFTKSFNIIMGANHE